METPAPTPEAPEDRVCAACGRKLSRHRMSERKNHAWLRIWCNKSLQAKLFSRGAGQEGYRG